MEKSRIRVLLVGLQRSTLSDFFLHTESAFICMSSTARIKDIQVHIQYFRPQIIVYYMNEDNNMEMADINMVGSLVKRDETMIVVLGDRRQFAELRESEKQLIDVAIVKPQTIKNVQEMIEEAWDQKQALLQQGQEIWSEQEIEVKPQTTEPQTMEPQTMEPQTKKNVQEIIEEARNQKQALLQQGQKIWSEQEIGVKPQTRKPKTKKNAQETIEETWDKKRALLQQKISSEQKIEVKPQTKKNVQETIGKARDQKQALLQQGQKIWGEQEIKVNQPKKHILVVDDDPVMLKTIKRYLEGKYSVGTAPSGKFALKFLSQRHTDLVLLDYEMPEVSGPDVIKMIRQNKATANLPVVFLTGITDTQKIKSVLVMQPDAYLLKPVDYERLHQTIERLLAH